MPVLFSAHLDALVVPGAEGGWSQERSIMDVDILDRLGRDDDDRIQVLPVREGEVLMAVELPRSVIAALTAEMRFQLAKAPVAKMLESVDLLDFPGYRGRLKARSMEDVRKAANDEGRDPVAELLLRGKVAYLFERYTDNQEMNVLVVCAASDKQSDVSDMGPVLESWINTTQGVHARRTCRQVAGSGLGVYPLRPETQGYAQPLTKDNMRKGWGDMTHLALTEKFGHYEWLQKWTPDQSIQQCLPDPESTGRHGKL